MTFTEIAHALKLAEAQLSAALRDSTSARTHARLLRRVAELTDAAERHEPESTAELRDMVAFFVRRSSRQYQDVSDSRDLDIALRLSNRLSALDLPQRAGPAAQGRRRPAKLDSSVADPDELAAFLAASTDRMVAIGPSKRYLAVSPANAQFHGSTPARMLDLHITEIIGLSRYETRAAHALRRSFAGEPQVYVYPLPVPGNGPRLIRCEMDPIRDRMDQAYCTLMRMTDITDDAAAAPQRPAA
ncbi:hypothetical protein [Palleronia pelagia]|uniref:PAS fold-containing protein n=1 Tax=Palleronia pelagia TaxID=387096 RepID=A0A1H8K6F7_9RHOB|nr:hypothetical protein [Palleronia pelagia]SEN88629.1 hypothetical protein SAMN04488011_107124 [Palleronia pelagia]